MADPESDYIAERNIGMERFLALGGGQPIELMVSKMTRLEDCVTQQHKDIVKDLATGMSHEHIALVMGISKERLQALFAYELEVGFSLAEANLSRSLYLQGLAGNGAAATNWLRFHKRSQWSDKKEMTDKGAKQEEDRDVLVAKAANDVLIKALIEGIAGDTKLVKIKDPKATQAPVQAAKIAPKRAVKAIVKKARLEDDQ